MATLFQLIFLCSSITLIIFFVNPNFRQFIKKEEVPPFLVVFLFSAISISSLFGLSAVSKLSSPSPPTEENTQVLGITAVPTIKDTPTPFPSATNTPTTTPTDTPPPTIIQTKKPKPTDAPKPTIYIAPATSVPGKTEKTNTAGWQCNCSKTCDQISTCDEAYFQLNQCGCSIRDGDHDGVPCETICPGG